MRPSARRAARTPYTAASMGLEIDRVEFDDEDRARFSERLAASLDVLAKLLARPGFGEGEASLGAELELSLVGDRGEPLPRNAEVLRESVDPRLTFELDRFNLEANLVHGPLAGASLSRLEAECRDCLEEVERAAAAHGARVAMIGILPTLQRSELGPGAMTRCLRYEALSRSLLELRDEPFFLDIHGDEDLELTCNDVTFEGAATSFQVHLRVAPARFADVYDAIQLATPLVLAASGNSPLFLGRKLWHETRIALFKQAVDDRRERGTGGRPPRVTFGAHWTEGPFELFAETVASYPPLLPVLDVEEPAAILAAGEAPGLRELRLHQGTVWRWNRAIYDPAEGGHLRVELRSLPAGPSAVDMVANTALHVGLALELAESAAAWRREIPFDAVHQDFYRAAREGLAAATRWPGCLGGDEQRRPVRERIAELLPRAARGLARAGVDAADSDRLLALVEERVGAGRTGAVWQREALARAERTRPRDEAIATMFGHYLAHSYEGRPVHQWEMPS